MLHKKIELHENGSSNAYITTYLLESNSEMQFKKRPVVVICPGGAYISVSDREGEPIALQFVAKGYHAVVLHYSVAPDAHYPTALLEVGRVVAMLRDSAEEWHIDTEKILLMGFSAGGHLAASYGCFWNRSFVAEMLACDREQLRPNGLLLGYPVITSGEFAHRNSFVHLLGDRYEELVEEMSLEKQVSKNNPPTFVWHTLTDEAVPVENSLLFAKALKDAGVSVELHVYPKGQHGLALANAITALDTSTIVPSCQSWIDLVQMWIRETYGELRPEN